MSTVQRNGRTLYDFSGRFSVAQEEALRAILTHEKIPYTTGAGPHGTVIEVEPQYTERVREVVQQWYEAMHAIHREVWSN